MPPASAAAYESANHHKYTQGGPLYRAFLGRFHDDVAALVGAFAPATVLDAGCGEGHAAAALKARLPDVEVTGVDADAAAVAYAARHHAAAGRFAVGSVYTLPFGDGAFDVALCSEVLEHLDRPEAALAELVRVARRGIVVTVPREPYFDGLNRLGQRLGTAPDPGHVQHWTRRSFAAFLERHLGRPVPVRTRHLFLLASAGV